MADSNASTNSSSDEESDYDTDEELQEAFANKRLKPGVHVLAPYFKRSAKINNVNGLNKQLESIKLNLGWLERLDMINAPAPLAPELALRLNVEETDNKDSLVNNDFKREIIFYRQAQTAVLEAIPRLNAASVKTKRPDDYFAQMAKSDEHMQKVREVLIGKEAVMERREKAKKLRELKKYGKKVQQEVTQKRIKEKKEALESVKKFRKGQISNLDFLDKNTSENAKSKKNNTKINKQTKRAQARKSFKEKRYGYGGQKKRSKYNDSKSSADVEGFNRKVHQPKNPNNRKGGGNSTFKGRRKGKGQRTH